MPYNATAMPYNTQQCPTIPKLCVLDVSHVQLWLNPKLYVRHIKHKLILLPVCTNHCLLIYRESWHCLVRRVWLSALPVDEHGFALHKGAFHDTLCLRYGWLPSGLPTQYVCGKGFSVDHTMNCPTGRYPTLRHNESRDFTADALSEVCSGVCVEPSLQTLSGETYSTAIAEDGACLDISADGFWGGQHKRTFFDVEVFNPTASSYKTTPVSSLYRRFEEKRRKYEQRIREVEMGSFVPLVFSTFGGMSGCTNVVYKRLAYLLSLKRGVPYSSVMAWYAVTLVF